jgi:hypothetical protein
MVSGITYTAEAANVKYTPKRNLMRHGGYLRGMLDLLGASVLSIDSGTKNYLIVTDDPLSVSLAEWVDITISDLAAAIFKPYYFNFKAPAPFALIDAADVNAYGTMSFIYRGETYYGFLIEVSAKLAMETESTFKLLAAPASDLTNLIL